MKLYAYKPTMIEAEYNKILNSPYLTLTGKLWDDFGEEFREN